MPVPSSSENNNAAASNVATTTTSTQEAVPLTSEESSALAQCEATITTGFRVFYRVGSALAEISRRKLYRRTHRTFEKYVEERFGMARAHANRMIASASVAENLSPHGDISEVCNEYNLRPLTRLEPAQQVEAWDLATKRAGAKSPSYRLVDQAAEEVDPRKKRHGKPVPPSGEISQPDPAATALETGEASSDFTIAASSVCPASDHPAKDEDFQLADGTTMAFSEWNPGFIPEDRIRFQLKAVATGWEATKIPKLLTGAVHSQKVIVAFAAALNRLTPQDPSTATLTEAPGLINASCRALQEMVKASLEEVSCRLTNVIVTDPQLHRSTDDQIQKACDPKHAVA